jgi:hypothetical protein
MNARPASGGSSRFIAIYDTGAKEESGMTRNTLYVTAAFTGALVLAGMPAAAQTSATAVPEGGTVVYVPADKVAATLVTGGQVVGGKSTAADEIRGDSINGGDSRPLVKGDVIIIPSGVPHLFKDVKAPFLYYVVKVTAKGGA